MTTVARVCLAAALAAAVSPWHPAALATDERDGELTARSLFSAGPRAEAPGEYGLSAIRGPLDSTGLRRGARRLQLQLPDGTVVDLVQDGLEVRGAGDVAWRGRAVGHEDSEAVLTLKNDLVFGRLRVGGDVYELRSRRNGKLTVEQLDLASFPPCEAGSSAVDRGRGSPPGTVSERSAGGDGGACSEADAGVVIDLLSVYSTDARAGAGGVAEVEALIQAAVDSANAAFINSNMTPRYRLVHTAQANYTTTGSLNDALNWVSGDTTVAALRDQYGADMVSIMVDTGSCGIGFVQRDPGPGFEDSAFQATDIDCALGNLTFAHEHGHNIGLEHNLENSSATTTTASYPWSFAHYVNGSFRTVMSYSSPCTSGCTRVALFSSPLSTYNGVPAGIDGTRDNTRTGDLVGPITAEFRPTVVPPGGTPGVVDQRIATEGDDVEEDVATGTVSLYSPDLEMTEDLSTTAVQVVGLRFSGLYIPVGATVTNARLEFVVDETGSAATGINIRAQAIDDAPPFTAVNQDVSDRILTVASTFWGIPAWNTVGKAELSPDLSAVVQEVVDRPGWQAGNSIVFVIDGIGTRTAEAADGDPTAAPLLHVEYTAPPTAGFAHTVTALNVAFSDRSTDCDGSIVSWSWDFGDGGSSTDSSPSHDYAAVGTYTVTLTVMDDIGNMDTAVQSVTTGTGTVEKQIATGDDDVEEVVASGVIDPDSPDLELVDDPSFNGDQTVGLRFVDLAIPQDVMIDAAHIVFRVDETGSGATDVDIRAEATDNAPPFSTVVHNVTSRTLTAAVTPWSVPSWDDVGKVQQSPDLSAVVQEVVDRAGWTPGNSLVFVISGSGTRTAEAYEGDSLRAARLNVEYSTPVPGEVSAPGAAQPLIFTSKTALTWEAAAVSGAISFRVYRGGIDEIGPAADGDCWQPSVPTENLTDTDEPLPGSGFFYLVSGVNVWGEGPLGRDSLGGARLASTPCP